MMAYPIYEFQTCNMYACSSFFEKPQKEEKRLFSRWLSAEEFETRIAELVAASWEAAKRFKFHAKSLFLNVRPFDIRQPCWSSQRWRSLT